MSTFALEESLEEDPGLPSSEVRSERPVPMSFDQVIAVTAVVGEPTRLRILALLSEAELTVSELTEILRQSQPRVSRHLKVLVEGGLIRRTPEGSHAFFRVARSAAETAVTAALLALVDRTDRVLVADAERLAALRAERAADSQAFFEANASNWERLRSLHVADDRVESVIVQTAQSVQPESMLDIGTGTGRMLELLGSSVRHGVGIDSSPKMLAVARANLERAGLRHCSVRYGDLYDLRQASGAFELVLIHQVLHLLDEPGLALREATRVLAPGGTLIVADFAPHEHEALRTDHAHRRLGFATESISVWFEAAGLEFVSEQTLAGESADKIAISVWVGHKKEVHI